jgi:hypothetical protein
MPRRLQLPPESPQIPPTVPDATLKDWVRRLALKGTWADVCAALFYEWFPVWKQTPQAQELNWPKFRRQVEEGARRFWFLDPQQSGRRGRPSDDQQCFTVIEEYLATRPKDSRTWKPPSQGELIRALRDRLPKLKKETWRKYALLWQILNGKSRRDFTTSDWKFLEKHRPEDAAREWFALWSSENPTEAKKYWEEMGKSLASMNKLPF